MKSESHHQPDYEEILRSLNKKYSTKKVTDSKKARFPLEQGAAKSRPLRYRKFIQAKDLSNKSGEELSCLFVTHPSNIETEGSLSETSKTCNNKDIKVQLGDLTVVSSSIEPSPCGHPNRLKQYLRNKHVVTKTNPSLHLNTIEVYPKKAVEMEIT